MCQYTYCVFDCGCVLEIENRCDHQLKADRYSREMRERGYVNYDQYRQYFEAIRAEVERCVADSRYQQIDINRWCMLDCPEDSYQ
jgi:hypothetical protein